MAGDWIKVEHATIDKPEVLRAADMLGMHRREALGLFTEFWVWLDKNLSASCPDFVRNMSRKSLDDVLHVPGFAAVLESIGWAEFDDDAATLTIINAERHNGNTAKTRALDQKRKKKARENLSGFCPDKNGPEKRREEKNKNISSADGFESFWASYPNTPRKVARARCLQVWAAKNLDPLKDQIVASVEALKSSKQWQDGFEPAPLTYLNQRRWEDAPAAPALPRYT